LHVGLIVKPEIEGIFTAASGLESRLVGPSGLVGGFGSRLEQLATPMTYEDISAVIEAFVESGETAYRMGFDGVQVHAAHGYLMDQFFWSQTNRRTDEYGGDVAGRVRFASEIVAGIRR